MKKLRLMMNRYIGLTIGKMQETMAFRFGFITSFVSSLVQTFVLLYVWNEVFVHRTMIAGFTKEQMMTYLIVSQCLNAIYGWYNATEKDISNRIRTGDIALDLVKPVRFCTARFYESVGMTVIQILFASVTLLIFIMFHPLVELPVSILYFLAFIVSAILGYICMFCISLITGLLSFVITGYWGLYYLKKGLVDLFSGALIPLTLLPVVLKDLANILPFKTIIYTPTMFYLGEIPDHQIVSQLALQALWVILFWILAEVVYRLMIRRVSVNGG